MLPSTYGWGRGTVERLTCCRPSSIGLAIPLVASTPPSGSYAKAFTSYQYDKKRKMRTDDWIRKIVLDSFRNDVNDLDELKRTEP